jgi:hypothetical protein
MRSTSAKVIIASVLALGLTGGVLHAAQDTDTVTINANVAARAQLTLDRNVVNFPDADPDLVPVISDPAGPIGVNVKFRNSALSNVDLTVQANQDLTSGTDTIGINAVKWTATGPGFSAGTMDKVGGGPAPTLGQWNAAGQVNGTQTYTLDNSYSYAVGNYSAVVTYTLTSN